MSVSLQDRVVAARIPRELLREPGGLTSEDLANKIGTELARVRRVLAWLRELGAPLGQLEFTDRRNNKRRKVHTLEQPWSLPFVCKVEHVERARSGMTGAGYYRATCWVPSEAGLRARFVEMVERLREMTDGSPRDRAEMEARG